MTVRKEFACWFGLIDFYTIQYINSLKKEGIFCYLIDRFFVN